MKKLDVCIVGYGTAGQAAAISLSRDGHRVTVYERVPNPGPVGAGFLLQPTGMSVLRQLGLLGQALQLGRRIDRLYGENASGRPVMDMRYASLSEDFYGLGLQRGAIFQMLDGAWNEGRDLRDGVCIVHADVETGHVTDSNGERHGPYDLVIAADGAGSRLRKDLPSIRYDKAYPWGALWCLLPALEWPHFNELRQRYRKCSQMAGLLPVGRRLDDDREMLSFFWSVETSKFRDFDAERFTEMKLDLIALWPECAGIMTALNQASQLACASYRDTILGKTWFSGRLVAIGDSAHAMSPQLGQGVNMALLDAMVLRNALRVPAPLPSQLADYSSRRRKHVAVYQKWSRWLTPLFQSHHLLAAIARDGLFYPLGKLPVARTSMLKVLTGTAQGLFGRIELDDDPVR